MSTVITSQKGDTVDLICWQHYRSVVPTEQVLKANPGLAASGPVLPAGIKITLPALQPRVTQPVIQLWD